MLTPMNGSHTPDKVIERALVESVQIPPETTKDGITSAAFGFSTQRGTILPPRGTRQREYALDEMYFMDEMDLIRGAFTNIAKIVASVGWEIKGDEEDDETFGQLASQRGWRLNRSNGVEYFQEVFRQANFGAGWGTLVTQTIVNYLRFDAGAYIEVIGAGHSYDPLRGPVMGLAHLDPLRTYPTGDPRYPAVYYDKYGGVHALHHSRVIRLVDMETGDERKPGYGDSALSRAISVAIKELWMSRYITTRLDDQPPPGVTIIGGMTRTEWNAGDQQYIDEQSNDRRPIWGRRKFYFTLDPSLVPKVENIDFQTSPENFDYRVYTDINVDRLANAIGVDRQEIMQLMSGNLGSGAQSVVLHQKSKGKTIGFAFQQLERKLNGILPDGFEFEFDERDSQETLESAEIAHKWGEAADKMTGKLQPIEIRTLLANQVEAVRDAISDTPTATDVMNQPLVAADDAGGALPVAPVASAQTPQPPAETQKDYSTTQAMFVQDVRDLLLSAISPNPYLDRRAFGVTLRSLLKNYGVQAYKDGMAQGGVYVDTLDPEDMTDATRVFIEQAQYVNGLADDVFKTKVITPETVQNRAMMWGKSLQQFNDAGLVSASANAMYMWQVGLTEHCKDCLRLNGQVHRIRTWKTHNWMPRSSRLSCHGYRCACSLVRTTEKARGRF